MIVVVSVVNAVLLFLLLPTGCRPGCYSYISRQSQKIKGFQRQVGEIYFIMLEEVTRMDEGEERVYGRALRAAVAAGEIVRPEECPTCGRSDTQVIAVAEKNPEGPLAPRWLCRACLAYEVLDFTATRSPRAPYLTARVRAGLKEMAAREIKRWADEPAQDRVLRELAVRWVVAL